MWFASRNQLPEADLPTQLRMEQGSDFERYAVQLFPGVVKLGSLSMEENMAMTESMIRQGRSVFQAGLRHGDLYARLDILKRNGDGWDIYEIKATTQVKEEHMPDLAFQKHICAQKGLNIKHMFIVHLNREYVKQGEVDSQELCSIEEVTDEVNTAFPDGSVIELCEYLLRILDEETPPQAEISRSCTTPYECPLKEECWSFLPEHHVLQLRNWRYRWQLYEQGARDITSIPDTSLAPEDVIMKRAIMENRPHVDRAAIAGFLDQIEYPIHYLDFETFDTAVPLYDNTRPYLKIPFQFSLHIDHGDGRVDHLEYLADGDGDPRPGLLKELKAAIGRKGSVIVYNRTFENTILKELARDFPEYADWIAGVQKRLIDLLIPFRRMHYYHPAQNGSASIKNVLPAITGKDYLKLEIQKGDEASALFFLSHIRQDLAGDREKIREDLRKYCALDTEGMLWIVEKLRKLVSYDSESGKKEEIVT